MQKINLTSIMEELDELLEHGGLTMGNLERFNALSWARKNLAEMPAILTRTPPGNGWRR